MRPETYELDKSEANGKLVVVKLTSAGTVHVVLLSLDMIVPKPAVLAPDGNRFAVEVVARPCVTEPVPVYVLSVTAATVASLQPTTATIHSMARHVEKNNLVIFQILVLTIKINYFAMLTLLCAVERL